MKKLIFVLGLFLALGFSCKKKEETPAPEAESVPAPEVSKPASQAQPSADQWVYMEYEILPAGQQSVKQKSWVKGKEFRMEMYIGGSSEPEMISFTKGTEIYMLHPKQKMAMKMSGESSGEAMANKPPEAGWSKALAEFQGLGWKVENRGKQTWEGISCEVWRVINTSDNSYVDYYVDQDQLARRFVYYDASARQTQEVRILKYEVGTAPGADAFTVPAGYQIMDMSQMPGMPGPQR